MVTHAYCMGYDLDPMGRDEARQWARDHLAEVSKAIGFLPQSDESISEWVQSYPGERHF